MHQFFQNALRLLHILTLQLVQRRWEETFICILVPTDLFDLLHLNAVHMHDNENTKALALFVSVLYNRQE